MRAKHNAKQVFLGIDLGTTALKAVLSDGRSTIMAGAEIPMPVSRPAPDRAEQNPEDWWTALISACRRLKGRDQVAGISFSGQMHGAVLLGQNARILHPAILWNDARAVAEAADLNASLPGEARVAGVRAMASFTAPKLLWLQRHQPKLMHRVQQILAPKDYLRFRLTGEYATDPVDASGMWLLDVAARNWCAPILSALRLYESQLPPVREATEPAGALSDDAARILGLPPGIPVITGTGDAAASAIGLGLIDEGDGVISIGTSAQIIVTKRKHVPAPVQNIHAFCHGLPQRWFQMAALLNGASPLAWIAARTGHRDMSKLLQLVGQRMHAPSPVMFLPYLSGERTPHDDPGMRAAFIGLEHTTDDADLTRAVMEGVALSLADCYSCLTATGTKPKPLLAVGGGTKSALWTKMIASALGRDIAISEASEYGAALGAARLARIGVTGEAIESVCQRPAKTQVINPDKSLAKLYAARLPQFRALYHAVKQIH